MDAVNCDSPYGPWHVVISGDLAAAGWSRFDAYYDITADPNTGNGSLHGEEHSVSTDGTSYDGPSTGTATVTANGDNYLIKLEIDADIIVHYPRGIPAPPGQDHIGGHTSRQLNVIAATDKECS